MANLVGIDLGTTYSSISKLDDTGRPIIIENSEGQNITPSIVSFENENSVVVGTTAMINYGVDENTFGRFKREMGTDKRYEAFGQTYNATTLSSFVLKKLKEDAEAKIGEISEAVVTIPANFSNEAREATLAAAKMAGLEVKNIINEPTAAALHYAFSSGEELHGRYAIYDLGGGTFDISLIKVEGSDIEVLNSEGISKLGGDDFDEKIRDLVKEKFKAETGNDLDPEDFTKNDAEEQKRTLTSRETSTVRIRSPKGSAVIELSKTEFENAISSMIAQAEMTCETLLDDSNLSPSDINDVILVGGSTRIPMIKESVKKIFNKEPKIFGNPDEAVTLGAALYVAYKANASDLNPLQQKAISQVKISDIACKYFGTLILSYDEEKQDWNTVNDTLIPKGEKLPSSVSKTYNTVSDNQTIIQCTVTESNVRETDKEFVTTMWEGNLDVPAGRPAGQEVIVTFSYDDNQVMKCSFLDVSSKNKTDIDLTIDNENINPEMSIDQFKVE
tara:strand:- start:1938 stop:3446 length:1509 start_codon:yes stop_codon:yes gene_type:complete